MDGYLLWLLHQVCTDEEISSYSMLLSDLHSFPFVATLPRDKDRIEDAEQQRRDFLTEFNMASVDISVGPSVLEVLVALARKLDELIGYETSSPARWFWYMLRSLNLLEFKNEGYDRNEVNLRLIAFMRREYEPDGNGGCCYFPCEKDLRNVDIWYQWMWYLSSLTEFNC